MINTRAAGDSRFARTGKDGAIYNADGVLLATVDSFTANVTYNNAAYSVLGNAQELETANTFKVALTMSQVVVEDDAFIQELVEAMESQTMPVWDFQAVVHQKRSAECLSFERKRGVVDPVQFVDAIAFLRVQSRHLDTRYVLVDKCFRFPPVECRFVFFR